MEDFIKYVEISNFKSIKRLKLDECKRINLFVGYPNVGKSNIIEALSLFSLPFLSERENLNKLIRVEYKNELLHNLLESFCSVETNIEKIELSISSSLKIYRELANGKADYYLSKELELFNRKIECYDCGSEEYCADGGNVMRYVFQPENQWKSTGDNFLLPPFGENIIDVLSHNPNVSVVKEWIKQEFAKFGLEYVIDKASNSLRVQRRLNDGEVLQLPYSSIADTLQRIIFYKTAIASNENSVLLFEEPEAHAFPPYIRMLTYDIAESKSNQFFIATHSPIIVNEFIEDAEICKELAIYIVNFKDNQTVVRRLTDSDLNDIFERGIDLFFDLERYLD
ncbi:MAG: AAA family ATPase [Prevotellaceae bacterium]|jgi:AAA15 family ATPase/GTPase|nr:AAA family ATPase [Prevotellaceae bacterium]